MKFSDCFAMVRPIALFLCCLCCSILNAATIESPTTKTIFQSLEADEAIDIQITLDLDIKVKVRGRSRRKYCDFPPLKLKFAKENLKAIGLNTNHNSIKLVTHCSEGEEAQKNVLEEYLAYKLYNVLTDKSFQVQLARVTYVDAVTGDSFEKFGIILENTKEMAERLGGKENEKMGLPEELYVRPDNNLFAVFQYMIGNEDWRPRFMRNIKNVELPSGQVIPVGYDFDAAGLVNTSYARPDRDLQLETVLQRQFMGNFATKKERQQTIDLILSKKMQLFQTIDQFAHMGVVNKKVATRYIRSFFDIVENKQKLNRAMPLKGRTAEATDIWGVM